MSVPVKNPTFLAGTPRSSGDVQTGEVNWTRGGGRTATVYSGAIAMGVAAAGTGALSSGGSILIFSGAGRVNTFTPLFPAGVALAGNGANAVVSGMPIVVYDSAITARSGVYTDSTIAESGRKILFVWQPPSLIASGAVALTANSYMPIPVDVPFQSGLCVMAISGATGFSIAFTPEVPYPG